MPSTVYPAGVASARVLRLMRPLQGRSASGCSTQGALAALATLGFGIQRFQRLRKAVYVIPVVLEPQEEWLSDFSCLPAFLISLTYFIRLKNYFSPRCS